MSLTIENNKTPHIIEFKGLKIERIYCKKGYIDSYRGNENPNNGKSYGMLPVGAVNWFRIQDEFIVPLNHREFRSVLNIFKSSCTAKEIWDNYIILEPAP